MALNLDHAVQKTLPDEAAFPKYTTFIGQFCWYGKWIGGHVNPRLMESKRGFGLGNDACCLIVSLSGFRVSCSQECFPAHHATGPECRMTGMPCVADPSKDGHAVGLSPYWRGNDSWQQGFMARCIWQTQNFLGRCNGVRVDPIDLRGCG